jgi:hypothetical protein
MYSKYCNMKREQIQLLVDHVTRTISPFPSIALPMDDPELVKIEHEEMEWAMSVVHADWGSTRSN